MSEKFKSNPLNEARNLLAKGMDKLNLGFMNTTVDLRRVRESVENLTPKAKKEAQILAFKLRDLPHDTSEFIKAKLTLENILQKGVLSSLGLAAVLNALPANAANISAMMEKNGVVPTEQVSDIKIAEAPVPIPPVSIPEGGVPTPPPAPSVPEGVDPRTVAQETPTIIAQAEPKPEVIVATEADPEPPLTTTKAPAEVTVKTEPATREPQDGSALNALEPIQENGKYTGMGGDTSAQDIVVKTEGAPVAGSMTAGQLNVLKKQAQGAQVNATPSILKVAPQAPTTQRNKSTTPEKALTSSDIKLTPEAIAEYAKNEIYLVELPGGTQSGEKVTLKAPELKLGSESSIPNTIPVQFKNLPQGTVIVHADKLTGNTIVRAVRDGKVFLVDANEISKLEITNTATGALFSQKALKDMVSPQGLNATGLSSELNDQGDKNALLLKVSQKDLIAGKDFAQTLDDKNILGIPGVSIQNLMDSSADLISLANPNSKYSPRVLTALYVLNHAKTLSPEARLRIQQSLVKATQTDYRYGGLSDVIQFKDGVYTISNYDAVTQVLSQTGIDQVVQFRKNLETQAREAKFRQPGVLNFTNFLRPSAAIDARNQADRNIATQMNEEARLKLAGQVLILNGFTTVLGDQKNTAYLDMDGNLAFTQHNSENKQTDTSRISLSFNGGSLISSAAQSLLSGGLSIAPVTINLTNTQTGTQSLTPKDPTMVARIEALRNNQTKKTESSGFNTANFTDPIGSLINRVLKSDPAAQLIASQLLGQAGLINPLKVPFSISFSESTTNGSATEAAKVMTTNLDPSNVLDVYGIAVLTSDNIVGILSKNGSVQNSTEVMVMQALKKSGITVTQEEARAIAGRIPALIRITKGKTFVGPIGGSQGQNLSTAQTQAVVEKMAKNAALIDFAGVTLSQEESTQLTKALENNGTEAIKNANFLNQFEGTGKSVGDITRSAIRAMTDSKNSPAAINTLRDIHNRGISAGDVASLQALFPGWEVGQVQKSDVTIDATVNGRKVKYIKNLVGVPGATLSNGYLQGKSEWVEVINPNSQGIRFVKDGITLFFDPGCGQWNEAASGSLSIKKENQCFIGSICLTGLPLQPKNNPGLALVRPNGRTLDQVMRTSESLIKSTENLRIQGATKSKIESILTGATDGSELLALHKESRNPDNQGLLFGGVLVTDIYKNLFNATPSERANFRTALRFMQINNQLVSYESKYKDTVNLGFTPGFGSSSSQVIERGSVTSKTLANGSIETTTKSDKTSESSGVSYGLSFSISNLTESEAVAQLESLTKLGFQCQKFQTEELGIGTNKKTWNLAIGGAVATKNEKVNQKVTITNTPARPVITPKIGFDGVVVPIAPVIPAPGMGAPSSVLNPLGNSTPPVIIPVPVTPPGLGVPPVNQPVATPSQPNNNPNPSATPVAAPTIPTNFSNLAPTTSPAVEPTKPAQPSTPTLTPQPPSLNPPTQPAIPTTPAQPRREINVGEAPVTETSPTSPTAPGSN